MCYFLFEYKLVPVANYLPNEFVFLVYGCDYIMRIFLVSSQQNYVNRCYMVVSYQAVGKQRRETNPAN